MSVADRRFSDEMVRGNERLADVAWAYARDYKGDWDVMVAAHDLAMEHNDLPVPIARMVLNVMRADPAAQHLLPPTPDTQAKVLSLDAFRKVPESHPDRRWGSIHEDEANLEEPPPKPEYSSPRIVSKRWNKRYAISTHKLSRVAHLLRTRPTDLRTIDYIHGNFSKIVYVPRTRAFEVSLYAHCGRSWTSYRYRYTAFENNQEGAQPTYVQGINDIGVMLSDDPLLYPVCTPCTTKEQRLIEKNLAEAFR